MIDRLEGGEILVSDSGGLTRYGISKRAHPDVDIENLTRQQAMGIYHRKYWSIIRADALPPGTNLIIFDMAVNMGVPSAVRLLQRVLQIREDGVVGPVTVEAAKGFRPQSELRALLNELRMRTYEDLARKRPVYVPYLYGWRCRVMRVADEAGRIGGSA